MAFINHPVEEPEKSLRDYASPRCEDIRVQESDSKLEVVRKLGNFRYILIPEIINMFMTNMSDPVKAKHVLVFKLNLK
jgi:hypothetical protein